jgi:hypothetical protein
MQRDAKKKLELERHGRHHFRHLIPKLHLRIDVNTGFRWRRNKRPNNPLLKFVTGGFNRGGEFVLT